MQILKKKTQQTPQRQPFECYTITLSGENYKAIEKLRIEGNFPDRDAVLTALLNEVNK